MSWICSNDRSHKFPTDNRDGFCTICRYGEGFLIDEASIPPGASGQTIDNSVPTAAEGRKIGLAVLLMDVSGSMTTPVFPPAVNPTRDNCVVRSVAEAVMSLNGITNPKDAYIMPVLFDDEVRPVFVKSVSEIVAEFQTTQKLSEFLKEKFTYGGTDINKALDFAKEVYDSFVTGQSLKRYGGPDNIQPKTHTVPAYAGGTIRDVPNIRVLIYTDGEDSVQKRITGNPFASLAGKPDVLLGAYFGNREDPGCGHLRTILSKCPTHNHPQFFVLDKPDRIAKLRFLFRMASSHSGFCPTCLAEMTPSDTLPTQAPVVATTGQ